MDKRWFRSLITSWDRELLWTETDLAELSDDLARISLSFAGKLYPDVPVDDVLLQENARAQAVAALDALARIYVRRLASNDPRPVFWQKVTDFAPELECLFGVRYEPCIDVNTATVHELVALPLIGDVIAKRIIAERARRGPFKCVDDLDAIDGLSKESVAKLKPFLCANPIRRETPRLESADLAELISSPEFGGYVRFARRTGVRIARFASDLPAESLTARLKAEIRGFADWLALGSRSPYARLPGTLASEFLSQVENERRCREIESLGVSEGMHGAVLTNHGYGVFVRDLLRAAKESIRVEMFFMRFVDTATYPTDEVIAELVAANARNVDVKIILDRDAEGSAAGATVINEEAYDLFTDKGVPVRWDTIERTTHRKLVVVDGRHTVAGSHNWTAGSFFAYDDISLYVCSEKLGAHYVAQFENLWREYEPPPI